MTSYRFFMVKSFPKFTKTKTEISNQVQMTLTGTPETIHTKITSLQASHKDKFERLRIETGIKFQVFGYTYVLINGKNERKDFTEYVKTVEFDAYLNRDLGALILKANDKVARGFMNNIAKGNTGVNLVTVEIDFDKVHKLYPRYIAAWFKEISPNVKSLGMAGIKIEDTQQFKQCLAMGVISALSIDYPYEDQDHPFVIGKRASVALYKNYNNSLIHESKLVIDIFEKLVLKTWVEKKKGSKELYVPTVVDHDYHDLDPKIIDPDADTRLE